MTPAGRGAQWALSVRFVIQAASEAEARAVVSEVLAGLDRELSLDREPVLAPRRSRRGSWVAIAGLDVRQVEPDDPENYCRYVAHYLGMGVTWMSWRFAIKRGARWRWRTGAWVRQSGDNGVLVHPALRAVRISCDVNRV
jgi:hypothetical protein